MSNAHTHRKLERALSCYKPQEIAGNYPEAAVLMPVTYGEQEPHLVLTRRAMHLSIHPGEAAFPGGKRDPEDDSLLATALREANEEVGLDPNHFTFLGQLDQRLTRTDIKVSPFVGFVPENVELLANPDELDCIYQVPITHFLDSKNMLVAQREYQGKMQATPHFQYQQHTVWGVTALMIIDLANTVFDAGLIVE